MLNGKKLILIWFLILVDVVFKPSPSAAGFRLVPVKEIFQVERVIIGIDGSTLLGPKGSCYKANIRSDLNAIAKGGYKVYVTILKQNGSNKTYLVDETYLYAIDNAIALDNNIVILVFHTGGTGCCSALVSFKSAPETGDIFVIKSVAIVHPEIQLSKQNVGDFDRDGNVEVLVGKYERLDVPEESRRYWPEFDYFLKIDQNGNITIDKNPKLYQKKIEKQRHKLTKGFNIEAYVSWMFYNKFLGINESGEKFLKKLSEKDMEKVQWVMNYYLNLDRTISQYIEKFASEAKFYLTPIQTCP